MNKLRGKAAAFRWEQKNVKRKIKIAIETFDDDINDGFDESSEDDHHLIIYPVEGSLF